MNTKPVVLCIEDDLDFRKALASVLDKLGLQVKVTANSTEFFEQARKLPPDLFLVDLVLGEENGLDVILRIRYELGASQPIIVLSKTKDTSSINKALLYGAQDFITKPLDRMFLIEKLAKFVMTDEIEEQKSEQKAIPQGGQASAKLTFTAEMTEVDEFGVKLQSRTMIPNGTVLKLSTKILSDLGIPSGECLVNVVNSWFDPDLQLYGVYAEFDGVDFKFLERVRSWLSR